MAVTIYPSTFYETRCRDVSLTLNVYSHVLPDMGGIAAGAMDDVLG